MYNFAFEANIYLKIGIRTFKKL